MPSSSTVFSSSQIIHSIKSRITCGAVNSSALAHIHLLYSSTLEYTLKSANKFILLVPETCFENVSKHLFLL